MPIKWYEGEYENKVPYYRPGDQVIVIASELKAEVVEYDFGIDDVKINYVQETNAQTWLKASQVKPNEPLEELATPFETIESLESN